MRGRIPATDWFRPYNSWNYDICYSSTNERCYQCDRCRSGVAAVAALYFVGGCFNIINANSLECQRDPAKAEKCQKTQFYVWRKNIYINELSCVISDDFFVFFRAVKHSKKILADNQLFTGLRDGSPGLSLGIPHPPYGAFPKSCLHQSAICRRMGGTEADVRKQIRHEVSVSTHP